MGDTDAAFHFHRLGQEVTDTNCFSAALDGDTDQSDGLLFYYDGSADLSLWTAAVDPSVPAFTVTLSRLGFPVDSSRKGTCVAHPTAFPPSDCEDSSTGGIFLPRAEVTLHTHLLSLSVCLSLCLSLSLSVSLSLSLFVG